MITNRCTNSTGVEHPAVDGLHWAMATAGLVTTLPWLMNMLRVVPGATGKFERFASWCYEQLKLKQEQLALKRTINKHQTPSDVMSWVIQAQQEGDRSAPPTESAIREDARTLISAERSVQTPSPLSSSFAPPRRSSLHIGVSVYAATPLVLPSPICKVHVHVHVFSLPSPPSNETNTN